jgi:hypothetical protein
MHLTHAPSFLNYFGQNLALQLRFVQVRPTEDYLRLEVAQMRVELSYAGKAIDKPRLFLNEARLSAIAISIYLGTIKRHVQGIPCKVLFLDDIFIGLDIANRLPLLTILESEFSEYQIFITTYDKPIRSRTGFSGAEEGGLENPGVLCPNLHQWHGNAFDHG